MRKSVYIDADILLYQIGFVTQKRDYTLNYITEAGEPCPVSVHDSKSKANKAQAELEEKLAESQKEPRICEITHGEWSSGTPIIANFTLKAAVNNICEEVGNYHPVLVITGDGNFREDIATIQPYKGNREKQEKPINYPTLRRYVQSRFDSVTSVGEEADDILSIALMEGHICATPDKDLNNTPGDHYNFMKKKRYMVTEAEALHNFYTQMLVGDNADNIPGINGVGPKTAEKILRLSTTPQQYETLIRNEYRKVYGNDKADEAMLEVGRLLWMRREVGELWELAS